MHILKKASAVLLTGFIFPGLALGASFSDVPASDPHFAAVEYLKESNIVNGYQDGTFQPGNTINRAEFTKIIIGTLAKDVHGKLCFPDVGEEWFAPYVCYAKEKNVLNGYEDGSFQPNKNINLAEALKVILKALQIPLETGKTQDWYSTYLATAEKGGFLALVNGAPDHALTRGEMAELIYNIQLKTKREQVLRLLNDERIKVGALPLKLQVQLNQAAQKYTRHMLTHKHFSHTSKEGVTFDARIEDEGYRGILMGENIAQGPDTAAEVMAMWMDSTPHRENILKGDFTEVGIGVSCTYEGGVPDCYWVQNFGG